jgi:2,3-dihydroxyphenylpropionate 1,2-dioxygenase
MPDALAKHRGMMVCVSHSPIIMIRDRAPAEEPEILATYGRAAEEIKRFDPELVIAIASDHFAGFHLSLTPPYCVGLDAHAIGDVGGFAGPLAVPRDEALKLLEGLREAGFDPAVSYRMRLDHAFSQPLHRLLGGLDRYPVIPLFVNAIVPPLLPCGRSRALGAALGRHLRACGKRVLVIGSGGLSHHPTRYYPAPADASPEVYAWELDGERGGSMSEAQWLERLHDMHVEGATMLVDGRRTREDICLNPDFDRQFMAMATRMDLQPVEAWSPSETVARAGIGSMELHAWVAAIEAYRGFDGRPPHDQIYAPTLEYGIGYGMLVAGGIGGGGELSR